jgi:hypothetical protein
MSMGSRVRPVREADKLTAFCEPFGLDNVGFLKFHNPIGFKGISRGCFFSLFYKTEPYSPELPLQNHHVCWNKVYTYTEIIMREFDNTIPFFLHMTKLGPRDPALKYLQSEFFP